MKIENLISTLVLLLILSTGGLSGQSSFSVKEATMTVSGTSTVHDWTSDVTEVNADGKIALQGNELKGVGKLTVTVPAASIKSTKGKTMDSKTWAALRSEEHPNIVFQLTEIKSLVKTGGGYDIKAAGNLSMAGETRPIELAVGGSVLGDGSIQFTGSKALKMTDFNMEPPTALLGSLKTGDEVTINFSVTLTPNSSN